MFRMADRRLCTWLADLDPLDLRNILLERGMALISIKGGRIVGSISGTILPSGGDWLLPNEDESIQLDIRATCILDDGSLALTAVRGRIEFPPDIVPYLTDSVAAAAIDPSRYYFRTSLRFETASEKYDWLNMLQAEGVGRLTETGIAQDIFEVRS